MVASGGVLAHNSQVVDDPGGAAPGAGVPRQVPEFTTAPPAPQAVPQVSDEDRQRYGVLLDSAVERGLIGTYDYEIRLRELAAADTIEEMNRIVSELPVFVSRAPARGGRSRTRHAGSSLSITTAPTPGTGGVGAADPVAAIDAALAARRMTGPSTPRAAPWRALVITVIVLVVVVVVTAIYASHLVHTHNQGLAAHAGPVTAAVSRLRP